MKLLALIYGKVDTQSGKVWINTREYNVSSFSFMYRNTVKETFKFAVRETLVNILKQSVNSERHVINHEENLCYIQIIDQESAVFVFCDQEYPKRLAFSLLQQSCNIFLKHSHKLKELLNDDNQQIQDITSLFNQFQDPKQVDKLHQAQNTLQETKVILHDNIKQLLNNQQDIDHLVAKSDDLSQGAKMFYKSSAKMNKKCCLIF